MDFKPVIITDVYSSRMHTFIWRHIKIFKADVIALEGDGSDLNDLGWKPYVRYLNVRKQGEKNFAKHALERLKEIVFGEKAPTWPLEMERIWDRYVFERRPDVALAEFGPNGMRSLESCQRHEIPLVVHFHGYDASSLLRFNRYRESLPDLFEKSAAVVVVSKLMLKTLEELGCSSSKLHVIPCGAPVDKFALSSAVEGQTCHFLAVASFIQQKGPMHTLRAFGLCENRVPNVTLTMIGAGNHLSKAQKWVKKKGLSRKVHLLGYQPIEVVRKYMRNSSIFVQHSLTTRKGWIEGWGVSMAEAAASGLPVIATNHGGIPDHVINGRTGFLVNEGDWETMSDKMLELALNPKLRVKMGLAGLNNIGKVGNLEIQIKKLADVLKSAVEFHMV